MTGEKIVYGGIRCYVKAKAAFMQMALKEGLVKTAELQEALHPDENYEGLCISNTGEYRVMVLGGWNDDDLERAFDNMLMETLMKRQSRMMPMHQMYLVPVLTMEHQEVRVESFCYLVNAMVCGERCRQELLKITEPESARYYQAYRESAYCDSPLLNRFLQQHKKAARMAIGMVELVRREWNERQQAEAAAGQESAGQQELNEYQRFMRVLYAGYKPVKNMVKRFRKITGEDLRSFSDQDSDMVEILSRMMVGLVMAQDLGITIDEDYFFYVELQMFLSYDDEWMMQHEKAELTKEERESFRQIRKQYRNPGSFHKCYFLQPEEAKSGKIFARLQSLFLQHRLNLRMLSGIQLERSEVEQLFAAFGPMEAEQFGWVQLTATLCKYIASLHDAMEEEQTEELVYERDMAEQERARIAAELLQLTIQAGVWESKWKASERMLAQKEQENEKLRERLEQIQKRQQSEKEELTGLREFVYQLGDVGEPAWMVMEEGEYAEGAPDIPSELADEKVLVVGGHQKWQKKMRQMLPCGTFVASDHRNFDATLLQNRKYIILNTDVLKHSIYYRIMAEKRAEQQVLYVHGCNMKRCFEELKQQIKQQE